MSKKLSCILLLFISIVTTNAQEYKRHAIKTNIFGVIASQFQLAFEKAINEHYSIQLNGGYINVDAFGEDSSGDTYECSATGFLIIPEGRYYFEEVMNGPYIAGFIRYRNVNLDFIDMSPIFPDVSYTQNVTAIGGGVTFGYQLLFSDALVFDLFIGPQYKSRNAENRIFGSTTITDADLENKFDDFDPLETGGLFNPINDEGVGIRFGFNLGVSF